LGSSTDVSTERVSGFFNFYRQQYREPVKKVKRLPPAGPVPVVLGEASDLAACYSRSPVTGSRNWIS